MVSRLSGELLVFCSGGKSFFAFFLRGDRSVRVLMHHGESGEVSVERAEGAPSERKSVYINKMLAE
jgi:hypothetical protein